MGMHERVNDHSMTLASKTGFQCIKWILNCDTFTSQFIAEEVFSWFFATTWKLVHKKWYRGVYRITKQENWNRISAFWTNFYTYDIVSFRNILLIEEF